MLQNVNLFGAFLKGNDPAADQPAQAPGVVDLVLRALAAHEQGVVPLKDLLGAAGGSLQALLDALGTLSTRRLVEEVDGGVRITGTGKDIAQSIGSTQR